LKFPIDERSVSPTVGEIRSSSIGSPINSCETSGRAKVPLSKAEMAPDRGEPDGPEKTAPVLFLG
jgi:hypothetical protein